MPSYILRNIDHALWARFKARAKAEGVPMRALVLLLITAYADYKISIAARKAT